MKRFLEGFLFASIPLVCMIYIIGYLVEVFK